MGVRFNIVKPFQILKEDGSLIKGREPELSTKILLKLYQTMLRVRVIDERMVTLQRQGRISFYGAATGQEAAVIGSAAALQQDEWVFPALRESGVALWRGYSLEKFMAQCFGNAGDILKGRQMPCHYGSREHCFVTLSSVIGTQIPQAVGAAMAEKIQGGGKCVIGYMGDGATSEADFHVGMNFAGVYKAPVILFCQNNQFAISMSSKQQTASETFAIKAKAYGFEGVLVDGNDVLAVYEVTKKAADKARAGKGPTFIEALTYRIGAHSTSDDPSQYRDELVTKDWKENKDPLIRMRKYLIDKKLWSVERDMGLWKRFDAEIQKVIKVQEKMKGPELRTLVEDVYHEVPWHLEEQYQAMKH